MRVTQNSSSCSLDPERRQRKLCYKTLWSRLLCLVLVLAVTVSALTSPVSAADVSLYMVDLLPASYYTIYQNGVLAATEKDNPTHFLEDCTEATWIWDAQVYDHSFAYYMFTLYITADAPDRVTFKPYYGASELTANLVGHDGSYYQYKVLCGYNVGDVYITGYWDEPTTGNFSVWSFVGYRDIGLSADSVNVSQESWVVYKDTAAIDAITCSGGGQVSLPYGKTVLRSTGDKTWSFDLVEVTVDDFGYDHLSSISFILQGVELIDFGLQVVDSMGNTVQAIEPEVIKAQHSTLLIKGANDWPVYSYQVTADLSGYNIASNKILLVFSIEPHTYSSTDDYTWFELSDCIYVPYVQEVPWYKTFWNWLRDGMNKTTNTIVNAISGIFGNSAAGDALSSTSQAMNDSAQDLENAQAALDSVDRPSVDADSLLGDMLTFDTGGLRVLSVLTSNGQVTAMLTVVFTFALCGYIFFGKKA